MIDFPTLSYTSISKVPTLSDDIPETWKSLLFRAEPPRTYVKAIYSDYFPPPREFTLAPRVDGLLRTSITAYGCSVPSLAFAFYTTVADPGEAPPPLVLGQTEARRAEKNCFWRPGPSPFLRVWMTAPPLPPLSQGLDPAMYYTGTIQ